MKKNFINNVHLEGYLYEHDLKEKVSGPSSKHPGTAFITGEISIATDEDCLNIVKVHYTYVTETFSSGSPNRNFGILRDIMDGRIKNVMANGKEEAQKISIDSSAIALNEFYPQNDPNRLVSNIRNEGGFIKFVNTLAEKEKDRNRFNVDILITNAHRVEADEDRETPEKVVVKGAVFSFKKELLPVEFTVLNPAAMDYFEDLGASPNNPVFTKVWGIQQSTTIVRKIVEESAFGEDSVRETKSSYRDFVITGAAKDPYEFDDESTLTGEELKNMMAEREVHLATVKANAEEYRKNAHATAAAPSTPATGGFTF